jgi:hypothetical protein
MVHHSIAVVITSFLTNFVERRTCELPRTPLLGISVNSKEDRPASTQVGHTQAGPA